MSTEKFPVLIFCLRIIAAFYGKISFGKAAFLNEYINGYRSQ